MHIIKLSSVIVAATLLSGCVTNLPYEVPEGVETTKVSFLEVDGPHKDTLYYYRVSVDGRHPEELEVAKVEGSPFVHETQLPLNQDLRIIAKFSGGNRWCEVDTDVILEEERDYRVYSYYHYHQGCRIGVFYQDGDDWVLVESNS